MASKWNDPLHNLHEHIFITDSCWYWTGCLDKDGYGISSYNKKKTSAHRVSWLVYNGNIEEDQYILHNCHNPSCVNPNHLRMGTQKDNIQDQIHLGTNTGKNRLTAKLNPELVAYIRNSSTYYKDLAKEIGVSPYCVWDVLHYRSWTHV